MLVNSQQVSLADNFVQFLPNIRGIGVAVSGGSDSMALLQLIKDAAQIPVYASSVNHGLRPEAEAECAMVGAFCAKLNIPHDTLYWDGSHSGNLQSAARGARYRLLADWANTKGIEYVALGHTADDQAETVIMRLGRGSGVDGLAGIPANTKRHGVGFLRPLLHARRDDLQAYLENRGVRWVDDPSNDDPSYDRVRIRQAMTTLQDLGVSNTALCQVAENMQSAATALEVETLKVWHASVVQDCSDYILPDGIWKTIGFETARRLLLRLLLQINGADYPPRRDEQMELLRRLRGGESATLAGCQITNAQRFSRELNAVKNLTCKTDEIWDNRWKLSGPHAPDLHIAALGDGIRDCPDWRETGLPRTSLIASPAVWRGDTLISAPLAGYNPDWTAQIVADFHSSMLTH